MEGFRPQKKGNKEKTILKKANREGKKTGTNIQWGKPSFGAI